MSEKKLRLVLTSAAVAASLLLTAADGNAAERTRRQREDLKVVPIVESRWESLLWKLLPRLWQKAVAEAEEKQRSQMDPEGTAEKLRSQLDPEG